MTMTRREIIKRAPPGTWGRIARYGNELYGVAADWGDASSHVYILAGDGEWIETHYQVAYFRHNPEDALRRIMRESRVPARRGRWFSA
jgi:hypothetical protein